MKKLVILLLTLCLLFSAALAETEGDFSYSVSNGEAKITAYTGSAACLTLPDTLGGYPVTTIGLCAFRDCVSLTEVVIPDGITRIGSNAFMNCTTLAEIRIPESVIRIDTHAFYGCAALKQLTLHDSLDQINILAFYGCSAVRYCDPDSLTAYVLTDVGYSFTRPDYPQLTLKAFEDSDGQRTFTVADCDESANSVSFPDHISSIESYAFFHCTRISEIILPDSITEIGKSAFEGCTALMRITIPSSVTSISDDAFSGCQSMTIITDENSPAAVWANSMGIPVTYR